MSKRWARVLTALLAVTLVAGASFGATKAASSETLKVATKQLSGVVADSTGKALADVQLRLMRHDKLVVETRTDKAGKYVFKDLTAGKYSLLVGAERALELEAAPTGKISALQIVVPQRKNYAAAALDKTQWLWAAAGTGTAAVAVATPVLAGAFDSGGHDKGLSPEL